MQYRPYLLIYLQYQIEKKYPKGNVSLTEGIPSRFSNSVY